MNIILDGGTIGRTSKVTRLQALCSGCLCSQLRGCLSLVNAFSILIAHSEASILVNDGVLYANFLPYGIIVLFVFAT